MINGNAIVYFQKEGYPDIGPVWVSVKRLSRLTKPEFAAIEADYEVVWDDYYSFHDPRGVLQDCLIDGNTSIKWSGIRRPAQLAPPEYTTVPEAIGVSTFQIPK